MADDELTASLAGIKERHARVTDPERTNPEDCATALHGDMPALVAAVEAALAHHVEAVIEEMPVPRFRYCSTCSGHPAWPCSEVEAITAALAGKEASDGH